MEAQRGREQLNDNKGMEREKNEEERGEKRREKRKEKQPRSELKEYDKKTEIMTLINEKIIRTWVSQIKCILRGSDEGQWANLSSSDSLLNKQETALKCVLIFTQW